MKKERPEDSEQAFREWCARNGYEDVAERCYGDDERLARRRKAVKEWSGGRRVNRWF